MGYFIGFARNQPGSWEIPRTQPGAKRLRREIMTSQGLSPFGDSHFLVGLTSGTQETHQQGMTSPKPCYMMGLVPHFFG